MVGAFSIYGRFFALSDDGIGVAIETRMPSTLFNVLFVAALIIPTAMYIAGVMCLMASLVVSHFRGRPRRVHTTEAIAH